jgi:sulfite exporter TauE/SafE
MWNALLYNLGRVSTYSVFGLVFGLLGRSLAWFGWQQKISLALGLVILASLVIPSLFSRVRFLSAPIEKGMARVRTRMSSLLFNGKPGSLYAFGLLNGLLPCGMVYMALAGAIATGTVAGGAGFMALFGLGTLPAMWALAFFGSFAKQEFRTGARRLFPALMAIMAVLLILRGLNLDIPYLSPALHLTHADPIQCHD